MKIERGQFQEFKSRLKEKRKFIQVITGPRQIGKTTMVAQWEEQSSEPFLSVSADSIQASNTVWIQQQWEAARFSKTSAGTREFVLIIDEIQKISNWSEAVKKEWDEDTKNGVNIKVVILGSSRLLIQQGLTESLAGRFETIYMGHWSFGEMKEAFDFDANQYVWFGGYPGAAELIGDEARWKEYVRNSLIETTISKDVLMMTRVDKPNLLKRVFELGCLYSGQILSFTKMLGQLQDAGNTVTLSHYLHLLDGAGLIAGLEKFFVENVRRRGSSPKFVVYNTALISAQMDQQYSEVFSQPSLWGRMVESAIGAHLLNTSRNSDLKVYYWRHRGDEVDFVLRYANKTIGLEVKSGATTKLSGMNNFAKIFKPDKVLLVGNDGLSWQQFLEIDPTKLF